METVSLSIMHLRTNPESAQAAHQVYTNLNPDFQRDYEAWTPKMKTRFIESMLLNRATNPIWTVFNSKNGSEEVLDGKHRLTTALKFLNNEFALDDSFQVLDPKGFSGKTFSELNDESKQKIRNYNFIVNKLDGSYRDNDEKLYDMYEILNSSSKALNKHELSKPIYKEFYKLIEQHENGFYNSPLYKSVKSVRGSIQCELIKILALSEERVAESFTSLNDLSEKWLTKKLTKKPETIAETLEKERDKYIDRLTRAKKYMDSYNDLELFNDIDYRSLQVPIFVIVTRSVGLIKLPLFNRHLNNLTEKFKKEILVSDLQERLGCNAKNAEFQKKLIKEVDRIIIDEIGIVPEKRFFSKEDIANKLAEQENKCVLCKGTIGKQQHYDGDHIIPWVAGGSTSYDNCQVVHTKCHKRKC
jgi:hypothetical protein